MTGYSYVITRDFGFAPNPFGEFCTLATCKPLIRRGASIGDIIIGITPKCQGNELIYAMIVEEKLTFNQYWDDLRFQYKKPVMNGSIVQMMGDNIYHYNEKKKKWVQLDSHHSYERGKINMNNVKNDTQSDAVLISTQYIYFGKDPVTLPSKLKAKTIVGRSHLRLDSETSNAIWSWLKSNYTHGLHSEPLLFKKFKKN